MSNDDKKAAAPPPSGAKKSPGALGLVLPALLAGGAAFGGARVAGAHAAASAHAPVTEHAAAQAPEPPGPTIALDAFVVTTTDATHRSHAMRVALSIECGEHATEAAVRAFVPRMRDTALGYLRGVSYEEAVDSSRSEAMRTELLERFHRVGALGVERVLITDLVVQ